MNPAASDGYFEISCGRMSAAPSMTQVLERQEYFFLLQFLAAGRADETRLTQKYVYRQNFQKKARGARTPTRQMLSNYCYSNRTRMRKLDEVLLKRLSANICHHQRFHQTDRFVLVSAALCRRRRIFER